MGSFGAARWVRSAPRPRNGFVRRRPWVWPAPTEGEGTPSGPPPATTSCPHAYPGSTSTPGVGPPPGTDTESPGSVTFCRVRCADRSPDGLDGSVRTADPTKAILRSDPVGPLFASFTL